ncbi:hypothetical protein ACJ73_09911 [Blastomyces percursus]|uniref:GPI inositol-deacylase winged helix domain-containing protein n=1 Tax=Blastomyces percursus TaxID=1658174 RepID=A0A1J9PQP8_9EURO|nr:hypothetical protein ACJ73_09911 [Blastomyces percursus]
MFLREIFDLQSNTNANIFATSRFIQEIERKFNKSIKLEIRAKDTDVQKYLHEKLQNCSSVISDDNSLQEEIKTKIAKAVDGMFLLVRLYVDSLACKTTKRAIKHTLQELEATSEAPNHNKKAKALDVAYKHAMERIQGQPPEHRELAIKALLWIVCAKRQLTCSELQHALAVEINESELDTENITSIQLIVSVCAGLVIASNNSKIIHLVHYTTQEYFNRSWKDWFPNAHTDVTKTCVTYLSFEAFETGYSPSTDTLNERLKSHILYDYAARNWGHHASESTIEGEKLILDLLQSTAKVSACSQAMLYGYNITEIKMTGLHLAAYFGLEKSTSALLKRNADMESKDWHSQTPLSWAAANGHERVVKLLLERNADMESKDSNSRTPLSWAAANGHAPVVKLLLERNADMKSKDWHSWTPLSWAAANGHALVVKLLLERNADIEFKDSNSQTLLSWAAENGHALVVKLLLERNADMESKDWRSRTPLSWAAENGHELVVKLLLERNADMESKDWHSQTPLSWAAENGHERVVKLLLERNADMESKDSSCRTPLSWAAENGHELVVKLLLERNADMESKDSSCRTPLSWAAASDHERVVKLLLERNADIEFKDSNSQTPLSWAAENGHALPDPALMGS